jgi:hypothetical protein
MCKHSKYVDLPNYAHISVTSFTNQNNILPILKNFQATNCIAEISHYHGAMYALYGLNYILIRTRMYICGTCRVSSVDNLVRCARTARLENLGMVRERAPFGLVLFIAHCTVSVIRWYLLSGHTCIFYSVTFVDIHCAGSSDWKMDLLIIHSIYIYASTVIIKCCARWLSNHTHKTHQYGTLSGLFLFPIRPISINTDVITEWKALRRFALFRTAVLQVLIIK